MGSLFFNFAPWRSLLPENCNFHETFPSKRKLNKKTHFGQKAASWSKIKEKRPHLKLNFTTSTTSIYLFRPFLKLGNGIHLILVPKIKSAGAICWLALDNFNSHYHQYIGYMHYILGALCKIHTFVKKWTPLINIYLPLENKYYLQL